MRSSTLDAIYGYAEGSKMCTRTFLKEFRHIIETTPHSRKLVYSVATTGINFLGESIKDFQADYGHWVRVYTGVDIHDDLSAKIVDMTLRDTWFGEPLFPPDHRLYSVIDCLHDSKRIAHDISRCAIRESKYATMGVGFGAEKAARVFARGDKQKYMNAINRIVLPNRGGTNEVTLQG